MRKLEKIVLQNLLKRGYALEQRSFLNEFPNDKRNDVLSAISSLQVLGFVMQDFSQNGIIITLPTSKIQEALREVSSIYLPDPSQIPIEELIPKKYSAPFHISEGEHLVNGSVSKYVFVSSKKDEYNVTCLVINSSGSVRSIHLGDIHDPLSLISLFLKEIDSLYPKSLFTKEDLKRNLPKELVGNNQPTKAATEYLCYEKYLVKHEYIDEAIKFERTGKIHPYETLDEIRVLHEQVPVITATFDGAKYAYHEEDGFYPILL